MKRDTKNKTPERGMEIFSECMVAMLYTDEEIKNSMSPKDADEFIEIRNSLLQSKEEFCIGIGYKEDDIEHPLAAEEETAY